MKTPKSGELYNSAEIEGLSYTNLITSEKERDIVETVLKPKLKQKKPVNLFCSFSYFTSNYTGINVIHELAGLAKSGFNLYLVMWDINCQTHPRFLQLLEQQGHRVTAEAIIKEKLEEIRALFRLFGAPENSIHLYLASDVLQRFMRKEQPNLFLKFYSALEKMNLNGLTHRHKASHIVQMPLDMFFANFFHKIYPEDLSVKAEVALIYNYQDSLYREIRRIMYENKMINNLNPVLLKLPSYPYLTKAGTLPEWNMSRHSIINHIMECAPSTEEIMEIYEVILKKFLDTFELVDEQGEIKRLSWNTFKRQHTKAGIAQQRASLGHNLRTYLRDIKRSVAIKKTPKILRLNSKNTPKLAKVLSRKPIMAILEKINGEKTQIDLSRELNIAPPNMSMYINMLKSHDLVEIDEEGCVHRKIAAINANFEVGMG